MPKAVAKPRSESGESRADRTHRSMGSQTRFEAVMVAAERSGLLADKSTRISSRISPVLLEQAKQRTGIDADTDLIAFALASVALEDDFAAVFEAVGGTVDPDLKLGF